MQPSYSELSLSGNELDRVLIDGWDATLTQDVVLGGAPFNPKCSFTLCQLKVPTGRTLTFAPGTHFDFSRPWDSNSPYGIEVQSGASLVAEGLAGQPITLTSSRAAAGETAFHWIGIWARAGSRLRLAHCDIGWASNGNFGKGAVQIDTNDAQVRDCRLHHNSGDGLYVSAPSATSLMVSLQDLELTDNKRHGLYLDALSTSALHFELTGGLIERNGFAGVNAYSSNSSIDFRLANLSLSGNGVLGAAGDPLQTAGIYVPGQNVSPVLESVTLTNHPGAAVYWNCNGSFRASGLTVSGNQRDAVRMPACDVYGGREWDVGGAGGITLEPDSWVTVKANAFLSIRPGSVLRFATDRSLSISGGTLFALGTAAAPIRFHGQNPVPGGWWGIQNITDGSLFLSHCDVAHGGRTASNGYAGVFLSVYGKTGVVQNCDIHDNTRGIVSALDGAVIRNNTIRDNLEFGVSHGGYGAPPVDARENWWGVSSGPFHATLNPTGEGDTVGNTVLFDPWLQAPPTDTGLVGDTVIVATGSPDVVSPGQSVDYSVQYLNLRSEAVLNALVVMQLPVGAEFRSATQGGVYWAARHQVVWRLGSVGAGALGSLSAELRFAWGLPRGYRDGSLTLFSGDNYEAAVHSPEDRAAYLAFDPDTLAGYDLITPAAYTIERGDAPALGALHEAALAQGYVFHHAAHIQRSNGATATLGVYLHPATRNARMLLRQAARAAAVDVSRDAVSLSEAGGGTRFSLDTGQQVDWGSWAASEASKVGGCTYESCKLKCRSETAGLAYFGFKAKRILGWTVLGLVSGGTTTIGAAVELGDLAWTAIDVVWKCDTDCYANANSHCCTAGQVKWTGGFGMSVLTMCFKSTCSAIGTWIPDGSRTCTTGTRCVASVDGAGCTKCDERASAKLQAPPDDAPVDDAAATCADRGKALGGGVPRCRDLELFVAKDPNDITGPDGDVVPGQSLDYTIRFENEGQGRAYGVYIVNALPDELDETMLAIHNGGWLVPATREIVWVVGELGPKGDPDSQGAVGYTISVRSGLPSGTPIANQAVVYFPSVPETTPTNTWVNLVQPLGAIPQTLATDYETPLPMVLGGREVSGLPLDFAVAEVPSRGTLAGTAPNLTYTPMAGAVGEDSFTFTVSNGTSTSRPAQVLITIGSNGDTDPPALLTMTPEDGSSGIELGIGPVLTDDIGPVYAPVISLALNEPLDPDTVTTLQVVLQGPTGPVNASVRFDAATQRIIVSPRVPLAGLSTYQLTLGAGITDVAGNPLPAFTASFSTAEAPSVTIFANGFETLPVAR